MLTAGGNDASTIFSGVSQDGTGTLDLIKIGTGTLTLTGVNTYTGGTTIAAGTLQIGSGGASGGIAGNVIDNGSLAFNRSGSVTLVGNVSGTGTLSEIGTGTLVLSGADTYTGATTVTAGTLQAGSATGFSSSSAFTVNSSVLDLGGFSNTVASLAGGVSGSVTNSGASPATLTVGGNGTSTLFSGTFTNGTGTLGLTKTGAGIFTLSGNNTYTGATTVSVGTLQVGSTTGFSSGSAFTVNSVLDLAGFSNTVASLAGSGIVTNSGASAATLTVGDNGTNTVFSGTLTNGTGTLGLTKNGVGIFTLSGNNTYTGATTVSAGTLQVGSTTGFSSGSAFTVNSVLDLAGFSNTVASLAGSGSVTNSGASPATLTAGGDGSSTAFSGTLANGTGSLGLTKIGAGTMTLTGGNTYTAGTTITAGVLQIGSGAASGGIVGNVTDNGSLTFNRTDLVIFPGVISGTGSLSQVGTGTLTLSVIDTYGGGTTISAGTLQIGNGGTTGSVVGNVADNSNLAFDRSDNLTYSGIISGTGTLSQIGTGTLTLTASNLYHGGTFASGAGTVSVDNDAELGITGGITLQGGELLTTGAGFTTARAVVINTGVTPDILGAATGTTATYTGVVSGPGPLVAGVVTHTGTLVFTGNNSYLGGTRINAGTLQIGNGGTTGSIAGNVTDNGNLAFNRTDLITFTGVVSGSGSLSQLGTGTLTVTGENSYTGGTTISAGTLQIGSGGTSGSIVGDVIDNGNLAYNRTDLVIFPGVISGTGSLSQLGTGTLVLTATDTYTGGTMISAGTLQIGNGGTTGSITGNVTANDNLVFDRSDNLTYSGVISGTGTLSQIGSGTLTLTANNLYHGGTLVSGNGTVSVDNDAELGATTGVIGGITVQGGELLTTGAGFTTARAVVVNTGAPDILTAATGTTATYTGVVSGPGPLVVGDVTHKGTLVFTGNNSYLGGTTISTGTLLQIGNGGTSGSVVGNVTDNGNLVFNRSDAVTFLGIISGTGTLNQKGPGTLILSGTSTYTGATAVSAGTLQVDGALGNTAVSVQSGGVLAGGGTIGGSVTIRDGGHLASEATAQTLSVGPLLLNPASILDYRLSTPGVIGSGMNTLVNVGGNLTLDGVLNVTNGGGFGSGAYRLINYGGALTNLTLGLGTLPAGFSASNVTVTTGVAGQVNLVVSAAGAPTQFWDGSNTVFDHTVHGGTGTWDNFTTNFTDAQVTVNQSWQNGTAVFSAAPGTVTLGDNILFQGMQFTANGYTLTGAGAFALQPTGTALITANPGVTATITAPISGAGGLTKVGLGLLSLTGVNTYIGGTTMSQGILSVASDANLGAINVGLILNGGELLAANGFSSARVVDIQAGGGNLATVLGGDARFSGNFTGTGNLSIGDAVNTGMVSLNGTNTYSGSTTIVSGATLQALSAGGLSPTSAFLVTGTLDLNGFSSQIGSLAGSGTVTNAGSVATVLTAGGNNLSTTFSGILRDGTGKLGLIKIGTGMLTLAGSNTYTGVTTVSFGTLLAGSATGFSSSSAFTVNSVLDLAGFSNSVASLAGSGSVTNSGGSPVTLTAGDDGTSTVFSGTLANGTGSLGLTKSGAGIFALSGSNSYTGGTTVSVGTLQAGSITGFSSSSAFTVNSVLDLAGFSNSVASLAGSGSVTNSGASPATLTVGGNGTSTVFSGSLANGTGSLGLTKTGAGIFTLTGNNTYTGATTVSVGTLQAGSITGFSSSSAFTVNSVLDLAGFSNSVASLAGSGSVTNGGGSPAILTAGSDGTNTVFSGTLANGTGSLGLTKTGAGAMTLTGGNTYTGGTTITAGTLQAGSTTGFSANSAFSVNSVLDLNGFSNTVGSLVGSGSVINNGGTPATLTAGGNGASTVFGGTLTDAAGTLGLTKTGAGTLSLTGSNIYSGGSNLNGGILAVNIDGNLGTGVLSFDGGTLEALSTGGGITSGKAITLNAGGGTFLANTGTASSLSGAISGAGAFTKNGSGTLGLLGTNAYTGGTTISAGTLQIGNGGTSGSIVGDVIDNGNLAFNRSDLVTFRGNVSGAGSLSQNGPGTLILTGTSTYTGGTAVTAGTLQVDGALGNTAVNVQSGTTLAGKGAIGGSVTIQDGGHLAPGPGAQTLSVGNLFLNPGSILDYQLNTPVIGSGMNTLVNVAGNLTLAGVLNVTTGGGFGSGAYRLINYTGALTNLTLDLGTLPAGFSTANTTVTTAVAGQVNLVVNAAGAPTQFWDGSNIASGGPVHGGTGTWINLTITNFTNGAGTVNEAWQNGFAIFTATPGTVTLGSNIHFQGMQFSIDGYMVVAGAETFALHPTGTAIIITDTGVTATIAAPIAGTGGLNKAGPGLLTLAGENTYSGGTTISGGVLSVAGDTNLGDPSGGLILVGGELLTTADVFNTARAFDVSPGQGTDILAAATGTTATYTGILSDAGTLVIGDSKHAGTVVLTGANTYSGGTAINSGTLQIGDGVTSGSIIGDVTDNGTIAFDPNGSVTFGGAISGTGNLVKMGNGIVILTANNSYTGNTTINAGTLQLGNGGISGGIVGNVIDDGNLAFNRSDAVTFSGNVSGSGTLGHNGPGSLTLIGTNTYTGGTTIIAGTLQLGNGGTSGSIVGDVIDNGNLAFNRSDAVTFSGNISGTGALGQNGLGSLILTGANTYTGNTTISAGTLQLGNGGTSGSIVGNVIDNGNLVFDRGDAVMFSGAVSGTGSLSKIGPGTLTLTGTSTYSGGTNIFPGTLSAAGNDALGSARCNCLTVHSRSWRA